jgi:hypothetical protein
MLRVCARTTDLAGATFATSSEDLKNVARILDRANLAGHHLHRVTAIDYLHRVIPRQRNLGSCFHRLGSRTPWPRLTYAAYCNRCETIRGVMKLSSCQWWVVRKGRAADRFKRICLGCEASLKKIRNPLPRSRRKGLGSRAISDRTG